MGKTNDKTNAKSAPVAKTNARTPGIAIAIAAIFSKGGSPVGSEVITEVAKATGRTISPELLYLYGSRWNSHGCFDVAKTPKSKLVKISLKKLRPTKPRAKRSAKSE